MQAQNAKLQYMYTKMQRPWQILQYEPPCEAKNHLFAKQKAPLHEVVAMQGCLFLFETG